jgi:hypothetical protein
MNLSFQFYIFSKSYTANFTLLKAELEPSKLFELMMERVSSLHAQNEDKDQEIIKLKDRIFRLEKSVDSLIKNKKYYKGSKIIKDKDLICLEKLFNGYILYSIFNSRFDGDKISSIKEIFITKKPGPSILLIKTTDKNIFGIYL